MVREVVFGVGFALLLLRFFGLNGVLYSMPVSDLLTFAICGAVIIYTCRTLDTDTAPTIRGGCQRWDFHNQHKHKGGREPKLFASCVVAL